MAADYERLRVSRYTGLDVNTAKIHMDEGAARKSWNFDFRRIGAARLRPGYARLYVTQSGPVQTVTDDFNRSNGVLGANWTNVTAIGTAMAILSNQAKGTVAVDAAFYSGSSFASDQYAFVKVVVAGAGGVGVRMSATQGYLLYHSLGLMVIVRLNPTSVTTLASIARPVVAGDTLELRAEGTSLLGYHNGLLAISATDSVISSGKPGMFAIDTTIRLDDFAAGNNVTLKSAVKVPAQPTRLLAFERDDDETRLVVADGTRLEMFEETLPEWGT